MTCVSLARLTGGVSLDNSTNEAGLDAVRVLRFECDVGFPGDIDRDGDVDVADLLALLAAWGPCPHKSECPKNLDGSGTIELADLLILLPAWRPCAICV